MEAKQKETNPSNGVNGAEKKKITKRTRLAIIASICAIVIIAAVVIPITVIFGKKDTVPQPYVVEFNDETDYYVRVRWNKIRAATGYTYMYYYGSADEAEKQETTETCLTANTVTSFPRHKGSVSFKVKANVPGEKTAYSEWITLDMSAWVLQTPIVTLDSDWNISWTSINYKVDDKAYAVGGYEYNIIVDGKEVSPTNLFVFSNSADIGNYIKDYLKNSDKIMGYNIGEGWQDITVAVKVRAVSYIKFGGVAVNPSTPNDALVTIYDDSDYGTAEVIVTEEIYKGMR